jgi:peptidoglycan hydrolase CwlO-like protein
MRIKEIEGVEYVAKSDMEAAVKDRISKLSARAVQAEEMATALQTELDNQSGRLGSLDTLQAKITELETQLTDANTRYDRHNAMAQNGFTDFELREAVEWAYNKAM